MELIRRRLMTTNPTVVAAIVGGLLGFVLLTRHSLVVGGTSYPLETVFGGSLLAGFLARRHGGKTRSAGIGAAVLAVLPVLFSVRVPIAYFIQTYGISGIGKIVATVALFTVFITFITVVTGSLGGVAGGWIGKKFTARSTA